MNLPKPNHLFKLFSTTTTASLGWRTQLKQTHLALQVSSILIQRQNWVPLLQTLNLSSKLTQPLFLQIVRKTQQNPSISLNFFNWAKSNLGFQPNLKSYGLIIQISLRSGPAQPIKPLLVFMVQNHHASVVFDSIVQACEGTDSQSTALSLIMECYFKKGLLMEGLEVFRKMRVHGCIASIRACNALLDAMQHRNEIRFAWCFYGAVIRNGILPDGFTWLLVAQILCKNGKVDRIVKILEMGICSSEMYKLLIDSYSKTGNFESAFDWLNKMFDRKLDPSFSTYSSILDGACKHEDLDAINRIMIIMREKKLLPNSPSEYDTVIRKLCGLSKRYAVEMLFNRACAEKIELQDATYGYTLEALSEEGKLNEAICIYRKISERGLKVKDGCFNAFVNLLCKEERLEGNCELLKDIIRGEYKPCSSVLSRFIELQCRNSRWREAEDFLNVILEKALLVDSNCCCSLVKHYCYSKQIEKAIELHSKMEKMNISLDVTTYNTFLHALFVSRRIEEALAAFDYIRRKNLMSSASFTIMIRELCHEKEMRKTMKFHDEMLKMGLKPDEATYKRLISGFK